MGDTGYKSGFEIVSQRTRHQPSRSGFHPAGEDAKANEKGASRAVEDEVECRRARRHRNVAAVGKAGLPETDKRTRSVATICTWSAREKEESTLPPGFASLLAQNLPATQETWV